MVLFSDEKIFLTENTFCCSAKTLDLITIEAQRRSRFTMI